MFPFFIINIIFHLYCLKKSIWHCRRYCTARLRRLYKSLKFTHGRGKYTRKTITESTVTDARFAFFPSLWTIWCYTCSVTFSVCYTIWEVAYFLQLSIDELLITRDFTVFWYASVSFKLFGGIWFLISQACIHLTLGGVFLAKKVELTSVFLFSYFNIYINIV